ncbi:RDD family protein [Streptosporangium roseum]|uniref:RDD family protein n=1 Tax=Streptosporangium roseum TaxID=2001 RepID=UPI003333EEB6
MGLAIALLVQDAGRGVFGWTFPPFVYLQWEGGCVALGPGGGCVYDNAGPLYAIGVPLALTWSIGVLAVLESRFGVTPGKYPARLRVVTETGLRLRLGPAVIRRLSFLLGPAAWPDSASGPTP